MRKMTAGTFAGESRVATPCNCIEPVRPSRQRHIPRLYVFSQNNIYGHPLHRVPANFNAGPFNPVPGGNGTDGVGADRVLSVTGTRLPDQRGVLIWLRGSDANGADTTGGVLEGAYTNSVRDFLKNDVITPGDIISWDATNYLHPAVRVYLDEFSDVFYTLSYKGRVEIWKADNKDDPLAGFSLHGTIQSVVTGSGTSYWENKMWAVAGKPYMVDTNRWVYVGGYWMTVFGQFMCGIGYWYSNDHGASWTFVQLHENGNNTNFIPGQIARSPTTGHLYSQDARSSAGSIGHIRESQDNGVTWAPVHTYSGGLNPPPNWALYEDALLAHYNCIFGLNVEPVPPIALGRRVHLVTDDHITGTDPWTTTSYISNVSLPIASNQIAGTAKTEILEV